MLLGVHHGVAQGGGLFSVPQLFYIPQVDGLPVDGHSIPSQGFELDPVAPKFRRRGGATLEAGQGCRRQRSGADRERGGFLLGQRGDVLGDVAVHLKDGVRHMEIGSRASGHQNGGNAVHLIEFPHPVNEGGDRLHVPVDDPLHQFVPDHEVGGAGVLIDKQQGSPRLHGLYHVGCLGGAAAGVLRGEGGSVLAVGQVVDEHGDIRAADAASVLRADFHRTFVGDYIFPAIPGDVVVYPQLQSFEKGGLSVIAAAYNQGNSLPDSHAGEFTPVGQVQGDRQLPGRTEGDSIFHR